MKRNLTAFSLLISCLSFGQGIAENQSTLPQLVKSQKIVNEAPQEETVQISASKPDGLNATTKVRSASVSPSSQQNSEAKEKNAGIGAQANRELCETLGLNPATTSFQELKAAMIKLQSENPEHFNQVYSEYQSRKGVQVRKITRETYNALPAERKALIDSHPEQYEIV